MYNTTAKADKQGVGGSLPRFLRMSFRKLKQVQFEGLQVDQSIHFLG